ncbi:metallophosphoesterase [Pseudorhodoferax sp. Leaf265]|uniref:metallophosphoesterase family protein n=1 Tax=Pseudorhodoferax sp. Leaf265 TaxID=1736315 RepID=UPI000ABA07FB|nr:metallophosphoesterase family protein [Pseudorhodoferax sp. Leaf265]
MGPVLYCGDPHGRFDHIIEAALRTNASAVVLLGDLEPKRALHEDLDPIRERVWWIPGNHDADSDDLCMRVSGSGLADRNVHGRVVTLPDGTQLAGLGGIFRESVWHPSEGAARGGKPAFRSRDEHAASTPPHRRWRGGHERMHWGTIYSDEVDRLSELQANVLVTHEAPGYHPYGFDLLDTLAQSMGVRALVHGHRHDRLDSSAFWGLQGFASIWGWASWHHSGLSLSGLQARPCRGGAKGRTGR